jgi:predicted dehydrogenase
MDDSGRLSVGIIGFGRIGAEHAAWIGRASNARVAAVADPTPARRAIAQQRGLKTCDSPGGILSDETIDAVLISTPTAMHHADASAALRAGKHVMVEKPMALDEPQARELVELAEKTNRVLSVFHNRRWDIDYLIVKHAIESGVFGSVINIESRIGQWASCVGPAAKEWRPGWRNEASFGGGGLYDWGSHFVDQVWRMMLPAKVVRVFAQLRGNVWSRDCDDFARVCLDFDNGAVAMVEINTTTTKPLPRWHIDGTLGSAEAPHSPSFDLETWSQVTFAPADGSSPRVLAKPQPAGLNETQIWERFAGAARGEGEPAVSARSVLTTMKLLDAARRSSASGVTVGV